jgi:hypothetical protein
MVFFTQKDKQNVVLSSQKGAGVKKVSNSNHLMFCSVGVLGFSLFFLRSEIISCLNILEYTVIPSKALKFAMSPFLTV